MNWGRKRRIQNAKQAGEVPYSRSASAAAAFGAAVCVLFFCAAADGETPESAVPPVHPDAAVQTFLREHAAFADAVGINEYFPDAAVPTGSFSTRGEEAYRAFLAEQESRTFGEYLREAWLRMLGLS